MHAGDCRHNMVETGTLKRLMDTTAQPQPSFQPPQPVVPAPPMQSDSYADAYVPPAPPAPSEPAVTNYQSEMYQQPSAAYQPRRDQPIDTVSSAPSSEPLVAEQTVAETTGPSEELADQNIFEMLGVTTGTPEQREQFLDELQQVIWEDFIEHDTKLLLTDAEQVELQKILQAAPDKSLEQQEQVVVYLEKLIPDLEDIMLEKALQLKEEMARERLRSLRELHRNDPDKIATIDRAEQQMSQQQWRSASELLNSLN